ncbi:hypothetical protein M514_03466, partial [Trichuris suis]
MEFPDLGCRCSFKACQQLDFLPIRCDACGSKFCKNHYAYEKHNCPSAFVKDVQVPVCPLCNKPVSCPRDFPADVAVSAHIDRGCQPDPTLTSQPVYSNKCSLTGCKRKEMVPIVCPSCSKTFCLQHRHPQDHQCSKTQSRPIHTRKSAQNSTPKRSSSSRPSYNAYQLNGMTEEAALQEALRRSLTLNAEGNSESEVAKEAGQRTTNLNRDASACVVS